MIGEGNFDMWVVRLSFVGQTAFILRNLSDQTAKFYSLLSEKELIRVCPEL